MAAVTKVGSSSGSGVFDGRISISVVGVGDNVSSASSVVGELCAIGSSHAVVGEGDGEIGVPIPGKLQADKPMRKIDINKRGATYFIRFILCPPSIACHF